MANCWDRPAMGSSLPARSIRGCCGAQRSEHPSARSARRRPSRGWGPAGRGAAMNKGEKPMYAVPDVDEVVVVAKELGIHLSPDEAVLYRKYLMEQLSQFDAFVQARLEEPVPPMVSAARKPGYRPRPEEDPLNAWMWKCRIGGAAEGVLAGKTVSYCDRTQRSHRGGRDARGIWLLRPRGLHP